MVSEGELSHAATVLELLLQQHSKNPASPQTLELFDTLVLLPGAYAVVKDAQAQGKCDWGLLADLETAISLLERPIGEYREELAAWAAISLSRRGEQVPQTIERLLAELKRAEENDRIGRMRGIIHEIMDMGMSSREPGRLLAAIEAFAKKSRSFPACLRFRWKGWGLPQGCASWRGLLI